MKFLVIGGAGYIGSHFIAEAKRQGHVSVVLDDLSRGHRSAISQDTIFFEGSLLDEAALERVTANHGPFDAIFHFAAFALVGESVSQPDIYYQNNAEGVRVLLEWMRKAHSHASLIFSSTCAVFGVPEKLPIAEDDRKQPISPYGRSKLVAEWMIEDYAQAYGLRGMALRYFNACGADRDGKLGEDHQPETHLIPNVLKALQKGEGLRIFGNDFPTKDGTCVRDYIHVTDLADAHIKAALYLQKQAKGTFDAFHLGTGHGYSNLEVVEAAGRVLKQTPRYTVTERRPGDPPALYADNRKAKQLLGFEAKNSDLESIIRSAASWHEKFPNGYSS